MWWRRPMSLWMKNGRLARPRVNARFRDEILEVERDRADFMDVSPKDGRFSGDSNDSLPGK